MDDLSSLLNSARDLTAHVARPDLPQINLSLDQIEAQSRRLVSKQQGAAVDSGKGNYLLARANVDAPALATSIAGLNVSNTFQPLNPIHDTDVAGFLRHTHEQTLVSAIEESRRQAELDFYENINHRILKDWEARKRKIFEELGVSWGTAGAGSSNREGEARLAGQKAAMRSKSAFEAPHAPEPRQSLASHTKMMAYDRAITDLNSHRISGAPFPLIAALSEVATSLDDDSSKILPTFDILSSIVSERPKVAPSHASAHIFNSTLLERAYARGYLGKSDTPEALELRRKIVDGSRTALETQYWGLIEQTIQQNPVDAALGGDPSPSNKVRAFLNVQYYKGGAWEPRLELIGGKPLWALMYYLIRTGHIKEAASVASDFEAQLAKHEELFATFIKAWAESADRRLPPQLRDRLTATFNSHILHAREVDPFKLALFRLIGRLDAQRRNIPLVIASTEDWAWFQLAMLDVESGGLQDLASTVAGYQRGHFEPDGKPQRGVWARLLLICGLFEKAVAALYEIPDQQVEAIHLAIALSYYGLLRLPLRSEASDVEILLTNPRTGLATLNFPLMIQRYIRQFQRSDPKEALQYIYCITLNSDKRSFGGSDYAGVGEEQLGLARSMVRKLVLGCDGKWDELVGAFRDDGTKFPGILERQLPLLRLDSVAEYYESILIPSASSAEQSHQLTSAIKLYNLAGAHSTVIACLTRALGDLLGEPLGGGEEGVQLEKLAGGILEHYSKRGDVVGAQRTNLVCLLKIREAMVEFGEKHFESALEAIESSRLIPFDGDVQAITRKAEAFKDHDEAITRNLSQILLLAMNVLSGMHSKVKHALFGEGSRQMTLVDIRKKARALMMFASMQRYRMSADVYAQLTRLDVSIAH